MLILLVENDEILGQSIVTGLNQQGYKTNWLKEGKAALMSIKHENYDAMILDMRLPDIPSLQLLQKLRNSGSSLPVIILTALNDVEDRITGLDAGSDDYLTKPFDLKELYARIRAMIKRTNDRTERLIDYQDILLNPVAHTVTKAGKIIDIPRYEYNVLLKLFENIGSVLSRSQLEEGLYNMGVGICSNTVEVYIHHLRKKLGKKLIRTIRGVGYIIDKQGY